MGAPIPLFGIGQASKSPYVTAKQITNLYCEVRPQGEKSALVAYGTPGLDAPLVDFGATPIRGGREFPALSVSYVVHRGTLYEVNNAGVSTARGTLLTTSGRVSLSDNGVEVMIVDGSFGYIFNTSTNVFTQDVLAGLPAEAQFPTTVTYLARRFVVNSSGSGRFYVSDIDDGLTWDPLLFANAETNPDPIIAVWVSNGQLALLGSKVTEYWGLSGAVDFPFALISGTATEWGLAATWSIAKYDNTMVCLMKNEMGQVIVAQINGYAPKPISTPDFAAIINGYANVADATAYSYMLGQHAMYVISFPSAGESWMYDGSTGFWSSLKSYGLTRYRGEFAFPFLNAIVVADYDQGRLSRINSLTYTDNGDTIEREIIGETIRATGGEFIDVSCLRVDMEVGVGLPGVASPYYERQYMGTNGTALTYASTPDIAAFPTVTLLDVQLHVGLTSWAGSQVLVSKGSLASLTFMVMSIGAGLYRFYWSTDGSTIVQSNLSRAPQVDGQDYWMRFTIDDNGGGTTLVSMYSSSDGVTWTLDSTATETTAYSLYDGIEGIRVGADAAGNFRSTGKFYKAQIYNGATLITSFAAADGAIGSAPFVSALTGETWTMTGDAAIAVEVSPTLVDSTVVPATPGANPQIGLSLSRDNGKTWGAEMLKPMGQQGQYATRVEWRRLGSTRVITPKLRITDAVPVCIVSASINPDN